MNKSDLKVCIVIEVNFIDSKHRKLSEYSGNIF